MATYTSNYGWTKPSGSDNVDISVLNNNLDGQDGVIHDAFLNMAPPFSESSTYAVDDIVLYTTGLYKCHTAVVTPGSWTGSTNWQVYKLSEGGSGGGGTSNYNDLTNKPSINGVTLSGDKTTSDLGITASGVGAIPSTDKGANGGVAELDSNGLVPASQLPSYVDDVLEGTAQNVTETGAGTYSATGFILSGESSPCVPESGKTYVDTTSNIQYRWTGTGTNFVSMGSNLALGETSSTAYRGDRGKVAYDHSQTTGNPHSTTKSDVGLGNVPNVSTNDQTPTFTEASTRNNIASGEKLSVILGKIQKFFNDLKTVAFSGSYTDLTNKPSLATVATSGSYNDLTDKLTFDNVPTDGSNNPVKSDGIYDSEKDIYAVMGQMGAKNLIPYPYYHADTRTHMGVTYTVNSDNTITLSGTADGGTSSYTLILTQQNIKYPAGTYILSGCPAGGSRTTYWMQLVHDGIVDAYDVGEGATITLASEKVIGIGIYVINGVNVTGKVYKPMLRLASDTDGTYQPYAKTNRELTDAVSSILTRITALES